MLKGLSVFPKPRKPRVLYVGVDEGKTKMKSFVSHLNKELSKCKFSKPLLSEVQLFSRFRFYRKASFTPHLTFGRWNEISVNSNDLEAVSQVSRMYLRVPANFIFYNALEGYCYPLVKFTPRKVVLFNSGLSYDGPKYTELKTFTIE